ncbi:MAG: PKD domain-containing protein [Planctomycetota bacterium]|nr:PKD domain-containing protein [Planctomycetota bacterium]
MTRSLPFRRLAAACILALAAAAPALAQDDLAPLSEEFDDPDAFARFQRVNTVEQWNADQLEAADVGQSSPGRLMLMPYASGWYRDYRGVLAFKPVAGDFVVTTDVEPRRRAGAGAPQAYYSLAGIMIRAPRDVTPQTWAPGGENYIFLSIGSANAPGTFQFEVKSTIASDSFLEIDDAAPRAEIRVARIGAVVLVLRRFPGGAWAVHRRYHRPDFPASLQVGLTAYTDWASMSGADPYAYNTSVIAGGNPDLVAFFDYIRYRRPDVPAALAGLDLANPAQVSDAQLLAFLGDVLDGPLAPPPPPPANAAPQLLAWDAASLPARPGDEILFSASASDADGDPLSFAWTFGDGASGSGANAVHAYAAPGTYTVNVEVGDGKGGTDSASFQVVIEAAPAEPAEPLAVERLRASLARNFARPGRDAATVRGLLALPAGFAPEGALVEVDLGGAALTFTLDRRGLGRNGASLFRLAARTGAFTLALKGDLGANWDDEGLLNATVRRVPVGVDLQLRLGAREYQAAASLLYTARLGRTGSAK